MIIRTINTTTGALDTLIKIKASEKDWYSLLIKAEEINELHTIFEEMFFESIPKSHVGLFATRYGQLSQLQKEGYISEMVEKYKKFGEYGFYYIAFHPLMRFK